MCSTDVFEAKLRATFICHRIIRCIVFHIGSFAVACLMVGASVDKHYTGFMSHSDGTHSNTTDNNTYIGTTASYETGTGNNSWLTGTQFMAGSPTASPSGDSKDATMSPEEIQARLEIVVSLTFIVGFIQVS